MRQIGNTVSPMSNEGRNTYVIEHLTSAMLELLNEKPLVDISISELVDKAGVGRASFYRNYENREDIIKMHLKSILSEWTDVYLDGKEHPLSEQIEKLFSHFERHNDFYSLLNKRGLVYLLRDVIIGNFGPKPDDEKNVAYAKAFVAYSLYGWIEVWFGRGMEESAKEMAQMFKAQGL